MVHSFSNKSPFSFNMPKQSKFSGQSKFDNKEMLFNKKKISSDILSMSSASSSSSSVASSKSSDTDSNSDNNIDTPEININKYDDTLSENSENTQNTENSEDNESDDSDNIKDKYNKYESIKRDKKKTMMQEINQKRELLYQMNRLESKGFKLPFQFNMESDLNEMQSEYNKLIREKEIDASIRFQRKMLMAFVTGTEYLNQRYDPFSIRLEGWSEQIHENLNDYDDIFEELHTKYKSTGKKMSPELRLFISLSGSAFMFHLTSRMFKENPLPNVENVLKSNPELMKQFQAAAAKQYITGNNDNSRQTNTPNGIMGGGLGGLNGGLFGMVSNLFNNIGGGPSRPQMYRDIDIDERQTSIKTNRDHIDIDGIINNVHSKISFEKDINQIETLSVSDEEITSIIEDTADIKILANTKNRKNTRTLNL